MNDPNDNDFDITEEELEMWRGIAARLQEMDEEQLWEMTNEQSDCN